MYDLKKLETEGILVKKANGDEVHVYFSLAQVCCDNLALNSIFGFIECFSSDYFCTQCYATRDDIQCKFREEEFVLRTVERYEQDLAKALTNGNHEKGVKDRCYLLSSFFHPVTNCTNDIMHSIMEGIIPFELSCVLHALVVEHQLLTLEELNRELRFVSEKLIIDAKNAPCELTAVHRGLSISPSMTATQMWCLLRLLPLAVCKYVDDEDENWLFLLELVELVEILTAPRFTLGMIAYLRRLVNDHLTKFKELFPT